jgi:GT2 family glycosyltransferase
MSKTNKLSIIILSYNTEELLNKCLNSVFTAIGGRKDIEVIVVDNCSSDNCVGVVKNNFSQVQIIENKKNYGFAAGNNLALNKCLSPYVLLLNPDTEISPNTLEVMLNYMDNNPKVGISTCCVKLKNGEIDDACHRGFPTPWNAFCHFSGFGKIFPYSLLFNGYHLGYQNLDMIHEIDACCGAFMMVRQEVGNKLKWLDEDYFFYGEDLDFCYRAKEAGWKIIFNPETSILHWKGAASGMKETSQEITTASRETRKKAILASTNAMKIFYQKHYVQKYPQILTKIIIAGIDLLAARRISKLK